MHVMAQHHNIYKRSVVCQLKPVYYCKYEIGVSAVCVVDIVRLIFESEFIESLHDQLGFAIAVHNNVANVTWSIMDQWE